MVDYPMDFGTGYKIQTVYANKTADGIYGDIYDFIADVEKEHPGAEVLTGYCVIDEKLGLIPDSCNDWNDSISEAIADYEKHIIPILEQEKESFFTMRPMLPGEREFTYRQNVDICTKTGLIGYLRADMGSNGEGFYSTFNDFNRELKSDLFKAEFDDVINSLREEGMPLSGREQLAKYCYSAPESSYGNGREYGFRIDTQKHTYLMRLNPHRGEYNLYCYCHIRNDFDRHLAEAEQARSFQKEYADTYTCFADKGFTFLVRGVDQKDAEKTGMDWYASTFFEPGHFSCWKTEKEDIEKLDTESIIDSDRYKKEILRIGVKASLDELIGSAASKSTEQAPEKGSVSKEPEL